MISARFGFASRLTSLLLSGRNVKKDMAMVKKVLLLLSYFATLAVFYSLERVAFEDNFNVIPLLFCLALFIGIVLLIDAAVCRLFGRSET